MPTQRSHLDVPSHTGLESDLERYFRHRIRLLGGVVIKMTSASARGVPDRLVMLNSRMFLVELKTLDGAVSPSQSLWHRKIRATGNRVHVLYGRDGVLDWLRVVSDSGRPGRPASSTARARRSG
jgi:hypothetical protein